MMNYFQKTIFLMLISLVFNANASNENMQMFDELEVHYIGLPTMMLQPQIAKTYGIERSRYKGFINIAILDASVESKPAISVGLSGVSTNLAGQRINLDFDKVTEGKAIYYIAQVSYSDEEIIKFDILINNNGKQHSLKFQQKFYVEQ
ncbi:DUF4426 domain-containing protein [Thalassotalea crassostreae]|uniref:DUF4426 domain-containing protein n=1 Tax=Thalassotalea crassostreae TaxID=1763536 RepID=UPI000B04307F|nr:DUF4426 domain-containing protein [Thalassotalea crassostreae]